MRSSRVRLAGVLSCAAFSLVTRALVAAPCGRPDVDATFPPNDSQAVPPNATLAAHYSAPADYVDEVVAVTGPGGDILVDVFFDEAESMLRAVPRAELERGLHVVAWPGLRGVATSRGLGMSVEFSVGSASDQEAPRFSGLNRIEWDLSREEDPCTETHEDRFWFDLGLGSVSDDLDPSLLAVVIFETRGRSSGSAPEQIAVRPMPENRTLRVERPATGGEKVCFAAVTRDLVNNVSGGGDEEVCVETETLPFFDGCSLTARHTQRDLWVFAPMLALFFVARRRGARSG